MCLFWILSCRIPGLLALDSVLDTAVDFLIGILVICLRDVFGLGVCGSGLGRQPAGWFDVYDYAFPCLGDFSFFRSLFVEGLHLTPRFFVLTVQHHGSSPTQCVRVGREDGHQQH